MKFCGKSCKNPKFFKVRGGVITSSFENQKIFLNKGGGLLGDPLNMSIYSNFTCI